MKQPWIYVTEYREDIKEIHITTNYLTFNNSRFSTIVFCSKPVIPKPTVRSTVLGEGTNSTWLFTPRETKALAKSKVHQLSRAWVTNSVGWVVILTDLKNMADCHE